jgi:hypothetical protein
MIGNDLECVVGRNDEQGQKLNSIEFLTAKQNQGVFNQGGWILGNHWTTEPV